MQEYAQNSMSLIQVSRGFLSQTKQLGEEGMSEVASVNGKTGWLGANGRPDLAVGHSIIAGQYRDKLPSLVAQSNQFVKQAQDHVVKLRVWPIPPQDIRLDPFL